MKKLMAANWKMYKTVAEGAAYTELAWDDSAESGTMRSFPPSPRRARSTARAVASYTARTSLPSRPWPGIPVSTRS